MLTIFTTAKPFRGLIKTIQINALRSWTLLQPKCEIILFGDEEGTTEIASELGIRHIIDVERNEYGTPLVRSLFGQTGSISGNELMCYLNADIILMSDFLKAIRQIKKQPFLLVGRRYDIDLVESVNFNDPQWEQKLRAYAQKTGSLHGISGLDYFIFPRGMYHGIPPFAIGRPGWDNWLVYQARHLRAPVIDGSKAITVIHQNHDYSHHPGGTAGVWKGPESQRNVELMGSMDHAFTMDYATALLTPAGLKPALTPRHIYFRMRALPVLHPQVRFLLALFKVFEKLIGAIRPKRTA